MGGYIAQKIAILFPNRVNKLILESTAAFTSERNKVLFTDLAEMLDAGIPYEIFLKAFMEWLFTPEYFKDKNKVDEFIKGAVDYPYRQSKDGFRAQVKACSQFNSSLSLDNVQHETLIIAGEKDILITRDEAEMLASRISNRTIKYIERAAHSLHLENAEDFLETVKSYLIRKE